MGLNLSKGNMYEFITHTFNTVKGICAHNCSYCYCKRYGKQNTIHFDAKELKTDLEKGHFIFVGSSNDMFASSIPFDWIKDTLNHCSEFDNKYLFQSKNPLSFQVYKEILPVNSVLCTTIETNRFYPEIMNNCPTPDFRAMKLAEIIGLDKYITIEPIMDFDLLNLVELIHYGYPKQVNIGADTGNNHLPEPSKEKILELIQALKEFTTVNIKSNLKRLI
jgi:DNA repair photolyase